MFLNSIYMRCNQLKNLRRTRAFYQGRTQFSRIMHTHDVLNYMFTKKDNTNVLPVIFKHMR